VSEQYFIPVGVGQVKVARDDDSRFFNHEFNNQGQEDIRKVARQYILDHVLEERVKKLSLFVLDEFGIDVDQYQRQTRERWYIWVRPLIDMATRMVEVLDD
jgi:hypothetical protein